MTTPLTSTALGLYNSSLDLLGPTPGSGNPLTGRAGQSDGIYVNAATGNLVVQRQDEYLASVGVDLNVLRTYNSQGQLDGDNDDNWRIGFYRSLINLPAGSENTAGSSVSKVFGDGSEHGYTYDNDPASATYGMYVSTAGDGAHDTLTYNASTQSWAWSNGNSTWSETYNSAGQLLSVQDSDGNTQTYTYDPTTGLLTSVTDDQGQVTTLLYNAARQLTQIQVTSQDENGISVTQSRVYYTYDINDRLSQVIVDLSPDGDISAGEVAGNGTFEVSDTYQTVNDQTFVTTYTYDGTSTRVASITQGDGTSVQIAYVNVAGTFKVQRVTDGQGGLTRYTYVDAQITDIKDPVGTVTRYTFDSAGQTDAGHCRSGGRQHQSQWSGPHDPIRL